MTAPAQALVERLRPLVADERVLAAIAAVPREQSERLDGAREAAIGDDLQAALVQSDVGDARLLGQREQRRNGVEAARAAGAVQQREAAYPGVPARATDAALDLLRQRHRVGP